MKRTAVRTTGLFAVAVLFAMFAGVPTAVAGPPPKDPDMAKVTFCHRDGADGKPYKADATTDSSSILKTNGKGEPVGHAGHDGGVYPGIGGSWGDIIPAFAYTKADGTTGHFPGLNVPAGQAWLDRGCQPAPKLTLVKEVVGTALATDWTLSAVGTTSISGKGGASGAVLAGEYALSEALTESSGPSGYVGSLWSCSSGASLSGLLGQQKITIGKTDVTDVTCTIRNTYNMPEPDMATLTLVKDVKGDGAPLGVDDFILKAAPIEGTTLEGKTGEETVTNVEVVPGDYVLSESPDNATDYTASAWRCGDVNLTEGRLTLVADQLVTCTITNTYHQPQETGYATLTLHKDVSGGGAAAATAWTLYAVGGTSFEGETGADAVTGVNVVPGEYVLSESPNSTNYTASAWRCGDVNLAEGRLTLVADQVVTCTITNTYKPPSDGGGGGTQPGTTTSADPVTTTSASPARITLSATVENHFGGKAKVADFTLTATGKQLASAAAAQNSFTPLAEVGTTPISVSGKTGDSAITDAELPPGTYSLSESALPRGYSKSAWVCAGGLQSGADFTVGSGQVVQCNITILDSAASVTSTVVTPVVTTVIPPVVTPVVKGRVTTNAPVTVDAPVAAPAQVTELAFTGAETLPLGLSGLLALLLGAGLILVSRRWTTD